jgi:hypothetical protein
MSTGTPVELKVGTFEWILARMKMGATCTRRGWKNPSIKVFVQRPDANSANTLPYTVMEKGNTEDGTYARFPLDLSAESIFAEDWEVVV